MKSNRVFGVLGLALSLSSTKVEGSWLSDVTGVNINIPAGSVQIGKPDPGAISRLPEVISRLPQDLANVVNLPGSALAIAIRNAKAQASNGAVPIPPLIRQRLTPYVSQQILDSVRANINVRGLTLNAAVMMLNRDVEAITLEDIVVFDTNEHMQTDYVTWAHELTHVEQYRNRGVDTFANIYVTNSWVLENEAYNRATLVAIQVGQQGQIGQLVARKPSYYKMNGAFYIADGTTWQGPPDLEIMGYLYPADPQTGNGTGRSVAFMTLSTGGPFSGQYVAYNQAGGYPAVRLGASAISYVRDKTTLRGEFRRSGLVWIESFPDLSSPRSWTEVANSGDALRLSSGGATIEINLATKAINYGDGQSQFHRLDTITDVHY
jgi:hypothetical protein